MARLRKNIVIENNHAAPTNYELEIEKSRAANKLLLENLRANCAENDVPLPATPSAPAQPKGPKRKRKVCEPMQPSRKSNRISKAVVELVELALDSEEDSLMRRKTKTMQIKNDSAPQRPGTDARKNGRIFGPIEGVDVGMWWETRIECGRAGVHPPPVSGIFGGSDVGAYSVAVSAGYPEDKDMGDTFTYTGSGGRELQKKNLRTAPQSRDQELTRGNAALDKAAKTGNPIRVIRGYKAALGPATGYRYDGLYKVVKSYQALNSEGRYKVYKFDFERLPGQTPVDYAAKQRALENEAEEVDGTNASITPSASKETASDHLNVPPTPPSSGDEDVCMSDN